MFSVTVSLCQGTFHSHHRVLLVIYCPVQINSKHILAFSRGQFNLRSLIPAILMGGTIIFMCFGNR